MQTPAHYLATSKSAHSSFGWGRNFPVHISLSASCVRSLVPRPHGRHARAGHETSVYVWMWIRWMMFILSYFSQANTAGDNCEPSPKRVHTVDDAGSQSPKRVRTSADDPGNDHLSENARQNTDDGLHTKGKLSCHCTSLNGFFVSTFLWVARLMYGVWQSIGRGVVLVSCVCSVKIKFMK